MSGYMPHLYAQKARTRGQNLNSVEGNSYFVNRPVFQFKSRNFVLI